MLKFRYLSDVPKSICLSALPNSMLKTLGSTKSITRFGKGGFEVSSGGNDKGCDNNKYILRLRTSASTDSSTSAAQVWAKYDEVGEGRGAGGKSVKKSSKFDESSKSPKGSKVYRFREIFTKALILRQLDMMNSIFRYSSLPVF